MFSTTDKTCCIVHCSFSLPVQSVELLIVLSVKELHRNVNNAKTRTCCLHLERHVVCHYNISASMHIPMHMAFIMFSQKFYVSLKAVLNAEKTVSVCVMSAKPTMS